MSGSSPGGVDEAGAGEAGPAGDAGKHGQVGEAGQRGAIVVVTPNAAIDITYDVPEPLLGETNIVTEVTRRAGGKGVNVSSVLLQLGLPVRMSGFLGGRAGEEMRELLDGWTAEQDWVDLGGRTTRCTTAIRAADGAATLFNEPGPQVTAGDWQRLAETIAGALRPGGVLVISGSWPPGSSPEHVKELLAAARQRGARTIVDTSGPSLVEVAGLCDVVKPNREELLGATGAADLASGAQVLLERGAKAVVVSDGPKGMNLYTAAGGATVADDAATAAANGAATTTADGAAAAGDAAQAHTGASTTASGRATQAWHADAPVVDAVNPTGAGDSAVAALAADLAAHPQLDVLRPEAIALAVAVSAAAVLTPVAGLIDVDAYEELLKTIKVERICL